MALLSPFTLIPLFLSQLTELAVLIGAAILAAPDPVTLLMTGPLTNLAWALDHHPQLEEDNIEELFLMGGALFVDGNVRSEGHDGSAEWNIFWDPPAAGRVWDSGIPIRLFGLDVTEQVPVTDTFIRAFGRRYGHPLSDAVGSMDTLTSGGPYHCWDALTAASLSVPDLCTFEKVRCEVIVEGPSAGRTRPADEGRAVLAGITADADRFSDYCLDVLRV